MTGPTHVAIALAATLAVAATGQIPTPDALGWVAVVVGSLAPDIDGGGTIARPGSLFGKLLPRWLARTLDKIGLTLSRVIRAVLGHRNATHWPVWAAVLIDVGFGLQKPWLMWLGWGYLWHIMGDFATVSGVPLLGPLITKDIKWSPIRTGTWPEWVISFCLWGVIFYYGWAYIPPEIQNWVGRFGYQIKSLIG